MYEIDLSEKAVNKNRQAGYAMKEKRNILRMIFPICGIVILYVVQYIAHRYVPFMMDDEWYSTNLATGEPLKSLADVLEGQVWHYLNWGGRSITHGVLQLTLMAGELCADILNVLMTILLAYLICVVAGQKKSSCFLLSSSMLIGFNANAKMSMFWQSGLVNYVYSSVWILLFLWMYLRTVDSPDEDSLLLGKGGVGILVSIGIVPLGLMSGWSNENMGPTCFLLAAVVICLRKWLKKKEVPLWMWLGVISALAGSVLVILAPGNFVRSAAIEEMSFGKMVYERFFAMFEAGVFFLFPIVLLLTLLLLVYLVLLRGQLHVSQILMLVGMVLSYGAMVLSPHYPDRATFGTMVLGIVVACSLIGKIEECCCTFKKYKNIMQVSLWIYSLAVLLQIIFETLG